MIVGAPGTHYVPTKSYTAKARPASASASASTSSGQPASASLANQFKDIWKSISGQGSDHSAISNILANIRDGQTTEQAASSGDPVITGDNPDPAVLAVPGNNGAPTTYYETNTNTGGPNQGIFPVRQSTDLKNWTPTQAGSIFPAGQGPTWAIPPGTSAQTPTGQQQGAYWAPEIHQVGTIQSGPDKGQPQYLAYYSARDKNGTLAIGAATSSSPGGPFTDIGQPLVNNGVDGQNGQLNSNQAPVIQQQSGGAPQASSPLSSQQAAQADGKIGLIDPTFYQDPSSGKNYLIYKVDGNSQDQTTPIVAQQLNAQGTATVGQPTTLVSNDQQWEGPVTEAPEITKHGQYYYLFFAGNTYDKGTSSNSTGYSVGVARSTSLTGPYEQHDGPIFSSDTNGGTALDPIQEYTAPGHGDVVQGPDGQDYWFYAAYNGQASPTGQRNDLVAPITWGPYGWPSIGNGSPAQPGVSSLTT